MKLSRKAQGTGLAGLFAFLLYFFTRVPGYMPGESAFAVNQALPDSMFPTFGHTLWHLLVRGLDRLPFGTLSGKLAVLTALCGSLAVMAVIAIAGRVRVGDTPEEERSPASPRRVRAVMLAVTLLSFLFSPPIWFGATRPLPQMFGLTLLLLTAVWTLRTFQQRSPAMLNAASLFWGWLVTEYATAWFFAPFFFLLVLATGFTPEGRFRLWRNLRLAGLFLLAAGAGYLFMAWTVLGHPHAPIQGIHNLTDAWRSSLSVQKNLLSQAAPMQGSLLILFLFGGPFLVTFLPKMQGTLEVRIGSILLHFACAVVNMLMLFHPGYSPWGMYLEGRLGVFMVVPSALLAISTGYLAGYWMNVLAKYDPFQPKVLRQVRLLLRALVQPVIVLVVLGSTWRNLSRFHDPFAGEVNRIAGEMAAALEGVEFYVGHSGFNQVLRLKLRDQGREVRVIDLEPGVWARQPYRDMIAALFAEEHPRLASMARIGPGPFLQTWMQTDTRFAERVRLGEVSELILRAGKVPVPMPFGLSARDVFPAAQDREEMFRFWEGRDMGGLWDAVRGRQGRGASAAALATFLAQESLRANNLGFLLEGAERTEEAFRAYRAARQLRPDNLSALLNLAMRLEDLPEPEQVVVRGDMEAFLRQLGDGRLDSAQLWRLSSHFGYIRHPRLMLERGWAWVVSGNPQLAVPELQAALRRHPGAEALRLQLAYTHFAGLDLLQSESEYLRILEQNPDSANAILGLARIAGVRGETDAALAYLSRLRGQGVSPTLLRREEVAVLSLGGRMEEALRLVESWLRAEPDHAQALLSRLLLVQSMGDEAQVTQTLERLEALSGLAASERLMLARFLAQNRQLERARRLLRPLLQQADTRLQALDLQLRLEVQARDEAEANKRVREILEMEPDHAFANYILGTLLLSRGNTREAIAAFETSIASEPSSGALNDLAFTLLQRGQVRRALELCDQAVLLPDAGPHPWATRAAAFLKLERVEEAADSLERALRMAPEHPPFLITLGEVYLAKGQTEEGRALVDRLMTLQSRLDPESRQRLQDLSLNLRNR